MNLKVDDVVMCAVKKIEGTTVFVDIEGNGEGSIVMSEVAAGRIRNLRDYVTVGKKIVCKILKISGNHIELSLRRVTAKEKEEIKEKYEKERDLLGMLKAAAKKPEEALKKIKEDYEAIDFLEEAKTNQKIVEKFLSKSEAAALLKILAEKKEKEKIVKKIISIKSLSQNGINEIKSALQIKGENLEIRYLGSSKFSISAKAADFKEASNKVAKAIEEIKNNSKEKKLIFESEEK